MDLDCPEAARSADALLPPTGWVFGRKTAPRSHRLYRVTDCPLDSASEKYADLDGSSLVELRGTGGLTVYPPSLHKDTGELVCWNAFREPAEVALDDLRRAVREVAAVALLARYWPAKGQRQDAYLALAGGLLRASPDLGRVERLAVALARATGDEEGRKRVEVVALTLAKIQHDEPTTGWPKLAQLLGDRGRELVRRACGWLGVEPPPPGTPSAKTARAMEPYRPFPVEALPAPLADFVRQGALALGCDPAYLALPALAVAASAVGNARAVRLKRGWEEPSVLWSAIVGDSGTLKSPAYLKAVAHLFRLQRQLLLEFKERRAKYQEELQEYKESKQAAAEGELAAALSKLEGYAARFALLHHVVGRVARGEDDLVGIGRESVEAGAALCRWFAGEARRIYSTLSETNEERDSRRLEEFIRARGGRITVRELMSSNCRRYPDAETAEAASAGLVEVGRARWVGPQTAMKGGRPI